jgi:hypothetical protein
MKIEPDSSIRETLWSNLAACGVPLMNESKSLPIQPTPELLKNTLQQLNALWSEAPPTPAESRELEAVQSLLLALQGHFPYWYKKNCENLTLNQYFPRTLTGRIIKLRRIALSHLTTYL